MTMQPNPGVQLAQNAATNVSQGFQNYQQKNLIEDIIKKAQASGNRDELQSQLGRIISQVDPSRQQAAIQLIEGIAQNMAQKKQSAAIQQQGINPDLPQFMQQEAFKTKLSRDRANNIFGNGQQPGQPLSGGQGQPAQGGQQGGGFSSLSNDQLYQLSGIPEYKDAAKIELKRRETAAKPTKRDEKRQEKVDDYVEEMSKTAPRVKESLAHIKRMRELSQSLTGFQGYGKALLGTADAKEFNALGAISLEPAIKALFPRGTIAREKFNFLKDALVPTASETFRGQQGKLNALESFMTAAEAQVNKFEKLYAQYGADIPFEELHRFELEAENLVNSAIMNDIDQKKNESDIPVAQEQPLHAQQEPLNASAQQPSDQPQQAEEQPLESTDERNIFQRVNDWHRGKVKEQWEGVASVGRGAAQGVGAVADFANWVGSFIGDSATVDVKKHTKEAFGKEMDFADLSAKAYDYLTGELGVPKSTLQEYAQSGGKLATEFALPLGAFGKAGRAAMGAAAIEGTVSGLALQTAKDADLGLAGELGALFVGPLSTNGPKIYEVAKKVAQDPKLLVEMGKDFINWVKTAPSRLKEKFREPAAKATIEQLELKPSQIKKTGELRTKTEGRQPLSEVFDNEHVHAMEAKMSQSPEGAKVYQPLFEEISKENFQKYSDILAESARANPKNYTHNFDTPQAHKELTEDFFQTVFQENAATKAQFRTEFNNLHKSRPKDARIDLTQTNRIIKAIDSGVQELRKGGTIPKDAEPIKYLESFKERLLELPKEQAEKVSKLKAKVEQAKSELAVSKEKYKAPPGKIAYKPPGIDERLSNMAASIAKDEKEILQLSKIGARVEEVEKGFRKINKALNWEKAFEYKDLPRLKLKGVLSDVLTNGYGKKNPKYAQAFKKTNAQYSSMSDTILSDMVFDFLHSENPEMVKKWLQTSPKSISDFDRLTSSTGNLFFQNLGKTLKSATAYEMTVPKIFTKDFRVRPNPGRFTPKDQRILHSLLGDASYKRFEAMQKVFAKDAKKFDAYLNKSNTAIHLSQDAKLLAKFTGFWDLLKGMGSVFSGKFSMGLKQGALAGGKLTYTKKDKILSHLFTDKEFQSSIIKLVNETQKVAPDYSALESLAKVMKKRALPLHDAIERENER